MLKLLYFVRAVKLVDVSSDLPGFAVVQIFSCGES